ncbi:MAG: aminotransferase class III-fold pyridoxal phosphate-dependent enzyme [Candidatus Micrarchaeota archaeon]
MNTFQSFQTNIAKCQQLQLYPVAIKQAYQEYIEDEDSNRYLDLLSGSAVATLGYANQEIIQAYCDTAKKLTYTNFQYSPTRECIELSERLFGITPEADRKGIIFGLGGSDAIEASIKCAQIFTGKKIIVNFRNAYHGGGFLSYLASDFSVHQDFDNLRKSLTKTLDFPQNEEQAYGVLGKLQDLLKTGSIAAVIIEPIQGDGGNIIPPKNFLSSIKQLCEQYMTILIADEILTGAGRTGKWFAVEHEGVTPDLIVLGKGFGGGYAPFSAVVGSKKILDTLPRGSHVSSYFAHPPTCSVVLKIIEIIEREKILTKTLENGEYFRHLIKRKSPELLVRGLGWVNGLEGIVQNYQFGKIIGLQALEHGVYAGYFGKGNSTLRIHPPLTLSKEQVEFAVDAIINAINVVSNGIKKELAEKYLGCNGFMAKV